MDGVGRVDNQGSEAVAEGRPSDRRRDSLFLSAKLKVPDMPEAHDVRVRNLSAGGLMAEFPHAIETGVPVLLELQGLGELTGTVAWATRGRVGIAFDQPIDPKRARKPVGGGSSTPVFAKPLLVSRAVEIAAVAGANPAGGRIRSR